MALSSTPPELAELNLFSEEFLCDGFLDEDVFLRCASPAGFAGGKNLTGRSSTPAFGGSSKPSGRQTPASFKLSPPAPERKRTLDCESTQKKKQKAFDFFDDDEPATLAPESPFVQLPFAPIGVPITFSPQIQRVFAAPSPAPQIQRVIATPAPAPAMPVLSDFVIDVPSRLSSVQFTALTSGRSTSLSWQYDSQDEMAGAWCDGQWFPRSELLSLSTIRPAGGSV